MQIGIVNSTPKGLFEFLAAFAPGFEAKFDTDELAYLSHHQAMMMFAEYFGANSGTFTEKQLLRLCGWLNDAVAAGGQIENAVSTCFLEHTRQLQVNRLLAPHLSPLARRRMRA